jgi:hypothetical protein
VQLRRLSIVLLSVLFGSSSHGTTRRVPEDYSTIQTALNAVESGDTVLVAVGTYAETLHAPVPSFVLQGDVVPDTGDYLRPIIDPSPLPDADSIACLVIATDNSQVYEDLHFRNGAQMYPRRNPWQWSGGVFDTLDGDMTFRRCVFDSTHMGFRSWGSGRIEMEQCHFRNNIGRAVFGGTGPLIATACDFSSTWVGLPAVQVGIGSVIRQCNIHHCTMSEALVTAWDCTVEDCIIQSNVQVLGDLIYFDGGHFARNLIIGNEVRGWAMAGNMACGDSVIFVNNVFLNNVASYGSPGVMFLMAQYDTIPGPDCEYNGLFEDNVFQNNESYNPVAKVISTDPVAVLRRNRFLGLTPYNWPCVVATWNGIEMRENLFQSGDYAVVSSDTDLPWIADARWNWWGDAAGPFHPTRNPLGLGAEVTGNLEFDPWYPDTSFLSVPVVGKPLPEKFVFDAYPNPFNGTVTLDLIPPEVMIVRVELFDVLGRKVKDIWSGPLAFQKQIVFDGSQLSSGIYFARVWQPIGNRLVALKKLMLLK